MGLSSSGSNEIMASQKSNISLLYMSLTSFALIKKCKKYKLPTHGTKKEIVGRIIEYKIIQKKINSKQRRNALPSDYSASIPRRRQKRKNNQLLQQSTTSVVSIPSQNNHIQPQTNRHSKKNKRNKNKKHSNQSSNKKKSNPSHNDQHTNPVHVHSTNMNDNNDNIQRWYKPPPPPSNTNKHQLALFVVCDHIGSTQLFTDFSYTIKQFKQQISNQLLDLPLNAFRLSIQNLKPLNKQHLTLSDYNIQRGTRIHVHLYTQSQIKQFENSFSVTIKMRNNSETFKIFSVQQTDSVLILKKLIENKYGVTAEKQRLYTMHGMMLNDELVLNKYIKSGDVIYLETRRINNEYFNNLLNEGIVSVIDINHIYSNQKEIIDIYYKFLKAMLGKGEVIALLQIERNKKQNKLIYESLLSTMKNKRECLLFHGTTLGNVEKIIINGFNRDYNVNAKYGKGTYFAENVRYAALYSKKDRKSGHCVLFVCRCIIGNYGLGKKHMDASELYDNDKPGQQYDSLVNDLNDPQIYIINRDYHAIPVYIILFKYKTKTEVP